MLYCCSVFLESTSYHCFSANLLFQHSPVSLAVNAVFRADKVSVVVEVMVQWNMLVDHDWVSSSQTW